MNTNQKSVSDLTEDELKHELKILQLALQRVPFRPAYLANRQAQLWDELAARQGVAVNE